MKGGYLAVGGDQVVADAKDQLTVCRSPVITPVITHYHQIIIRVFTQQFSQTQMRYQIIFLPKMLRCELFQ